VKVGSAVQTSGVTANNFTNPVIYTVFAADRTTQSYAVTVTAAANPAKAITSYGFMSSNNPGLNTNINGTISGTNIALTVPYGTALTSLVATFTATGTSVAVGNTVQKSGVTANNFTSPVIYVVTAADGTT
jgi:hypothetical protein